MRFLGNKAPAGGCGQGIQVYATNNNAECLELLRQIQPDLIVTNLAIPSMDGWTLLERIRANPATSHIPVVAITTYHSSNVAQDAEQAGFSAYFPKPVHPDSFVGSLTRLLETSLDHYES